MAIVYTNSLPTGDEAGESDQTFCKPFCKLLQFVTIRLNTFINQLNFVVQLPALTAPTVPATLSTKPAVLTSLEVYSVAWSKAAN